MIHWVYCSDKERIARWENCIRVLQALTPHERRKHWNMGDFGFATVCGTIACAAGHCGMDPWFRRRVLKLKKITKLGLDGDKDLLGTYYAPINYSEDVEFFFGSCGSRSIFFNGERRSVDAVIRECKIFLKQLQEDISEGTSSGPLPG